MVSLHNETNIMKSLQIYKHTKIYIYRLLVKVLTLHKLLIRCYNLLDYNNDLLFTD